MESITVMLIFITSLIFMDFLNVFIMTRTDHLSILYNDINIMSRIIFEKIERFIIWDIGNLAVVQTYPRGGHYMEEIRVNMGNRDKSGDF